MNNAAAAQDLEMASEMASESLSQSSDQLREESKFFLPSIVKQNTQTRRPNERLKLIQSEFSDKNSDEMFDRDQMNDARAQAIRDAAIAFDKLDINGDGTINYEEAELFIEQGLQQSQDENDKQLKKDKLIEFFKTFDEDGDHEITKEEWLGFYAKLFDSIIENGLNQERAQNQ